MNMHVAPFASDAELLRVGEMFEIAWALEAERWKAFPDEKVSDDDDKKKWQAASDAADRTADIVAQIERLPARTVAGVMVKVRVCAWSHSGEPFDDNYFGENPTMDLRVAAGVLRDLLAIDGRPLAYAVEEEVTAA